MAVSLAVRPAAEHFAALNTLREQAGAQEATLFTQQATAQSQLEEVRRRRALEMGQPGIDPSAPGGPGSPVGPPSGYL